MEKEIIVVERFGEQQIAILENNKLAEFYIDNPTEKNIIGNIYKCKVSKIVEGVSACFVELKDEQNAYLYSKDISPKALNASNLIIKNLYEKILTDYKNNHQNILNYIKPGDSLIVQGKRNSYGKKHPKVTCKISIPGKYIVFLPFYSSVAISKKIIDSNRRKYLRNLGKSICKEFGLIFRTCTAKIDEYLIIDEIEKMKKLWNDILSQFYSSPNKQMIYKSPSLLQLLLTDFHHDEELKEIKASSLDTYNDIINFCDKYIPHLKNKVSLHLDKDLYEVHKINDELDKALQSNIWLKSGSYIVLNQAEALTSIDINTGKFNSRKKADTNMYSINLEAIKEICRQIRIRNIGGIIIIDLLPMSSPSQFNELFNKLKNELSKDKAKIRLSKDDNASLAIIIRKKTRDSLSSILSAKCPYCKGLGFIKSPNLICRQIINEITAKNKFNTQINIIAHPSVISILSTTYSNAFDKIKEENSLSITLTPNSKFHINKYEIEYII